MKEKIINEIRGLFSEDELSQPSLPKGWQKKVFVAAVVVVVSANCFANIVVKTGLYDKYVSTIKTMVRR